MFFNRWPINVDDSRVNQLKQAIVTEWSKLLQRLVNRATGQWCRSLGCDIQQQSGHIKHLMKKRRDVTFYTTTETTNTLFLLLTF